MENKNKEKVPFTTYVKRFFSNIGKYWWYNLIILFVIVFDQITKKIVLAKMALGQTIPIIQDILHITYTENKGMAFGLLSNRREVFIVASIIGILVFFGYLFGKNDFNLLFDFGLTFVIGGGIGNLIDRIGRGSVTDMIEFRFVNFAIFNVADSFVTVGAGMIMLALILEMVKEVKKEKEKKK